MPEPLLDTDKYGLSTLARRWTPRGMVRTPEGRRMMEAIADQLAYTLNILVEFEQYLPILLNPSRCLDEDLERILALNGIDAGLQTISVEKMRRLAILAPILKQWRGSFLAHRSTSQALTGGSAILRDYIIQRVVVDESSFNFILINEGDESETDIFVLGQGPSGLEFQEAELLKFLMELAQPALDKAAIVPCFALTAWKDGFKAWTSELFDPVPVASNSAGESEALDLGPAVDAVTADQYLRTATGKDPITNEETEWITVWFKTGGAVQDDFWEVYAYASALGPTGGSAQAYLARVRVGSSVVTLHRKYAGAVGAAIATIPFVISDSLVGEYHRLDFFVIQSYEKARLRVVIDGNSSAWYDDAVTFDADRPTGVYAFVGLNDTDFTQGTLRIAAITARVQRFGPEIVIPPFTAPNEVANLIGWWDGGDPVETTYNGSNQLTGIGDKSTSNNDMVVPSPAITPTSYDIDGVPTDLPGPFPVSVPVQHARTASGLGLSLGDFTVMLLVPNGSTRTSTSTYLSLNFSGSPFYALQLKQSGTPGALDVQSNIGIICSIDVGFDNSGAGHSIVFVRRSSAGNTVKMDAWYDKEIGAGIVKPTQVSGADTISDPASIDLVAFGGRNSITYTWQGTSPIHESALWNRELSDAEVLSIAKWAGDLFGYTGIS